jgi:WD40 repeat protein
VPELRTISGLHWGGVLAVAFSGDGSTLASAGLDRQIRLWDLRGTQPRPKATLEGHSDEVVSLAFAPNRPILVSGGLRHDCSVRLWDVSRAMPEQTALLKRVTLNPQLPSAWVRALAFAPDGGKLAIPADPVPGEAGGTPFVKIWDFSGDKPKECATLPGPEFGITALVFSPDGKTLACGHSDEHLPPDDSRVLVWSLATDPPKKIAELHDVRFPIRLCFSPDGRFLASGGSRGIVRLWEFSADQFILRAVLQRHKADVSFMAYHPAGDALILAYLDGCVAAWRAEAGDVVRQASAVGELTTPAVGRQWALESEILGASLSPDGKFLAACGAKERENRERDGVLHVLRLPGPLQ